MHIVFKQFCKTDFLNSPDSEYENSEFMKIHYVKITEISDLQLL